jgi:hypothetical protein
LVIFHLSLLNIPLATFLYNKKTVQQQVKKRRKRREKRVHQEFDFNFLHIINIFAFTFFLMVAILPYPFSNHLLNKFIECLIICQSVLFPVRQLCFPPLSQIQKSW